MKTVVKKMTLRKIKATKYRTASLYPMDGGMVMCFLDDSTLLFGDSSAVKMALNTRDGEMLNVDTNPTMADMMSNSIRHNSRARNAPRPAEGKVDKIVIGCT